MADKIGVPMKMSREDYQTALSELEDTARNQGLMRWPTVRKQIEKVAVHPAITMKAREMLLQAMAETDAIMKTVDHALTLHYERCR